ncbi:undecaprenyldiphospho-muramoylpentapeptide beta-N-acetylglucosaminyltransferase [Segetibacter sp. 3557_3]|uniref:undecaprenyldiphospho-muramoylpentapeptide beta-N-acetylglucosaminyltransferase n=1 Tax=Segetibacter sp. 3557_3 TaxID=2547429 RepID=UPI001FB620AD|nr:undecaprenyldiphospho-muramoylpentapeptide beta-N-acetylglucosaminyltransferase [Segetibacter sp. 3557_3]
MQENDQRSMVNSTGDPEAELRIIIAGGGTGGHIFPAIAIANALKKQRPGITILFVGAKGKMEMEKVPLAGYPIEGLDIAGFNRSSLIKNISLPFKLLKSFWQVRQIFKAFKPHAVIGVGGYSSFPVLKQAQFKGVPTFIHESNSFAGKSNIMLGRLATRVFVASDGMEKFFPAARLTITGNPVRKSITELSVSRHDAIQSFGLDTNKTTVLIVGGSLGAKSINDAIGSSLRQLADADLQLMWQTGKTNAEVYRTMSTGYHNVYTSEFITGMETAYAAADLVISRAGAMAVAELCVVSKPVIFVPYPFAAEDHQTVNAKHLADRNAALVIADKEVKEKLVPQLIALAKNKVLQQELKENIARLAITNADEVVATQVLSNLAANTTKERNSN